MMNMMKKILLVCIMLLGIMIVIPGVLADTSGTAAVSGNPALTLGLTVDGSNDFGGMITGENVNTTSNSVVTNVSTNAPWAITVNDALTTAKPGATVGKMAEWDGAAYTGGKVLTDALNVGSASNSYVVLSGAQSAALWTGDAVASQANYPWFKQTIEAADTRAGFGHTYRIVVTFTATAL
jgi:hypothetical protein